MRRQKKAGRKNKAVNQTERTDLTGIYITLLFILFPLAIHHGYTDILTVKTNIFYILTGSYLFLMCIYFLTRESHTEKKFWDSRSVSDFFALGFLVTAVISWLCNGNKKEQFFGTYGRNMGLLAVICCVLLYLTVRATLQFKQYVINGILAAGMVVCSLAVINHLGFDPLSAYVGFEADTKFLSTLGNRNTLAAYIALLLPFGMTLFMFGKQWKSKIYYGIFCFIGFLGMTAADSDSAYLVTGVTFLVLLLLAKGAEEGFYLITLVAIYSVSELLFVLLRRIRGKESCLYLHGGIPEMLLDVRINLALFVITLILLFTGNILWKQKKDAKVFWKWFRIVMLSVTAVFAAGLVIFMIYVNVAWTKHEAKEQLGALYSYLYFSNAWGTKRLRIWRAALQIYERMPIIKKLIGVGPAGFYFASQTYLSAEELAVFTKQGQLIDAHNEYLQYLVTYGMIGVVLFIGYVTSAIGSILKVGKEKREILAFAMAGIAFLVQAVVNNAHIYIDTLAFVLLAMGMSFVNEKKLV